MKKTQRRELSKAEEKMFAYEVLKAKQKELRSFVDNEAFEVVPLSSLDVKPQSGRWLLTWKQTAEGWVVKARLCVRGFEDTRSEALYVRSPTAGRLAQRLVLSVAAICHWELISADVPTAFLQGKSLDSQVTKDGKPRIAAMNPPSDCWDLIPLDWLPFGLKEFAHYTWRLLVAVYGLKDAPRLWIDELTDWLIAQGWIQSHLDEQVFYRRSMDATLQGMFSLHMDDLAVTGEPYVLDGLVRQLKKCYGRYSELVVQRHSFRHLGYRYSWGDDGSYTMDLKEFISNMQMAEIKKALPEELLANEYTVLRGLNGQLSYACGGRPDAMGWVAESCSKIGKKEDGTGPTWQDVATANAIIEWLRETADESGIRFPRFVQGGRPLRPGKRCKWLRLVLISDSAFQNLTTKHSQMGFVVLLVEIHCDGQLGGRCHLIGFGSKRSTRVARSTFAAELLAATHVLEKGELVLWFLSEIWSGASGGPRELMDRSPIVGMDSVIDARGLFDCLVAQDLGKLTDKSTVLYVMAYRDAIKRRVLEALYWVPSEAMLADDLTKSMESGSGLWEVFYKYSAWLPQPRLDLSEDWVSRVNGVVTRYRTDTTIALNSW